MIGIVTRVNDAVGGVEVGIHRNSRGVLGLDQYRAVASMARQERARRRTFWRSWNQIVRSYRWASHDVDQTTLSPHSVFLLLDIEGEEDCAEESPNTRSHLRQAPKFSEGWMLSYLSAKNPHSHRSASTFRR